MRINFDALLPLGQYLVVTQEEPEEKVGSVITPEISKRRPCHGRVVAAPTDHADLVGKRVLFEQFAGKGFTLNGGPYLVMPVSQLYGVIGEDVDVGTI